MTMKARVRTDATGNITVYMDGGLDFENCGPLHNELDQLTKHNPTALITIDMDGLDFVGSSGISMFVDTLRTLNKNKDQIRLTNVKTEFLRVFKLYDFDAMSLVIDQFDDDETENLSQRFAARSKTFQN